MKVLTFACLAMTMICPASVAMGAEKVANVSVVGLEVYAAAPDKSVGSSGSKIFGRPPGTRVHLEIAGMDRFIIGIDHKASKLLSLTDDKGTDLTKQERRSFGPSWLESDNTIGDGKSCIARISAKKIPKASSREIRIKARIAVNCGLNEKTKRIEKVRLKTGTRLTAGPIKMKIKSVKKGGWGPDVKLTVTLSSTKNLNEVKMVEFFDNRGKKIEHDLLWDGREGWGDDVIYWKEFGLHEKVSVATVAVTYFEKIETIIVPIDIAVGPGLAVSQPSSRLKDHKKAPMASAGSKDEKKASMYMKLADGYERMGKSDQAAVMYKRVIELYPKTAAANTAKEKLKKPH